MKSSSSYLRPTFLSVILTLTLIMEVLNLLQDSNVHFHLKRVIKELMEPYITKTLLDFIRLSFSLNITFEFILLKIKSISLLASIGLCFQVFLRRRRKFVIKIIHYFHHFFRSSSSSSDISFSFLSRAFRFCKVY